ncbi:MAG: porin [Planctomycetota bacterium]
MIRPNNSGRTPFELRFNIHNQFRYTGFANSNDLFVDSAGNTIPISARNDFDINRGRFVFSGYAFDPNLEFYTNVDYNTVANDPVLLLLSWVSYRFGDALTIRAGLLKVPGTWEWEQSSRFTLGAERSLATTFFRPSITAGVWAQGTLGESVFYRALVGDGFNTFTLRAAELDVNLAYSALLWWEKGEHFGVGYSDLECHESLSLRVGHGFTYASNDSDPIGEPGPEQTVIRLSDGTRLVEPGAIAPGVTVNEFDISLYTVHLGLKRRGQSFAAEYFFRWLTSLAATGPIPDSSLFDHGFFAQGGAFVIPKRLELYAIGSQVRGEFGSGTQIGGGVNWYVKGERGARFTFDVSRIEDSPADQNRTGLVAGGSGTLFRVQWWHFF